MSKERGKPRIPDELVDRFFDRELDEGSRERFFGMLRGDLRRCADVARTQRVVSMLRRPVPAPDLTDQILARIEERRGFLPLRLRRWVKAGRLAAAACILCGILGYAVGRRYAPDAFRFTPEPRPVTQVIESGRSEAAAGVQQLAVVVSPHPATAPAEKRLPRTLLRGLVAQAPSVQLLPRDDGQTTLVVHGGAGGPRFVLQDGMIIDRATSRALPALSAVSPEGLQEWLRVLRADPCEAQPADVTTAGTVFPAP